MGASRHQVHSWRFLSADWLMTIVIQNVFFFQRSNSCAMPENGDSLLFETSRTRIWQTLPRSAEESRTSRVGGVPSGTVADQRTTWRVTLTKRWQRLWLSLPSNHETTKWIQISTFPTMSSRFLDDNWLWSD